MSLGPWAAQVLDAPGLRDDFYRSQLDWSARNWLAICLGAKIWLWHGTTEAVRCIEGRMVDVLEGIARTTSLAALTFDFMHGMRAG